MTLPFRVGHGFDAHRLAPGRPLVLGGVRIPFDRGPLGHSDGDVLTHAVADALLGALALGDLGKHFPSSDARWKDASSLDLLRRVVDLVRGAGGRCRQMDATLLLEEPRLAPHVASMVANLAEVLGVTVEQVSVKATTADGMGFTGRGEGIAAWAVALVEVT